MELFRCYYCPFGSDSLVDTVDHSSSKHATEILKIMTRELNVVTGS